MPIKKLKAFLDTHHIAYITITHSLAFNAQRVAATTHIPGRRMAKTVMVLVDGKMAMAVLPAPYRVNLKLLKEASGASNVELAHEMEFKNKFPDCEPGAMPPFGNLYGMDVFVAESFSRNEDIVFNAGTHTELIQLSYRDFERLVKPKIMHFSTAKKPHTA